MTRSPPFVICGLAGGVGWVSLRRGGPVSQVGEEADLIILAICRFDRLLPTWANSGLVDFGPRNRISFRNILAEVFRGRPGGDVGESAINTCLEESLFEVGIAQPCCEPLWLRSAAFGSACVVAASGRRRRAVKGANMGDL